MYSKDFYILSIILGIIAISLGIYYEYIKYNHPIRVMSFIILILLTTNIGFLYKYYEDQKKYLRNSKYLL